MSDTVTNVEIEDVLASIRRLVLEGAQPRDEETAPAGPDKRDRLVLSPALRVVEPRGPLAGVVPRADNATGEPAPMAEIVPELPDPAALHAPEPMALSGDVLADPGEAAAERAGRLEAAMTARPDEWEPDGSEPVPVMDWSRTSPEDAPVFRSRHVAPLRLGQPVVEPAFRHTPPPPRAAEPEEADPDGLDAFVAQSAAAAREEAELQAALARGVIDEAMLRRVVTQVLHQELQGALGERITRNVRKLVRREITRALMDGQDG